MSEPTYTPALHAELKRLHEAATPGIWWHDKAHMRTDQGGEPFIRGFPGVGWQGVLGYQPQQTIDNMDFVAEVHNALPALLAHIESLEAQVERLKSELEVALSVANRATGEFNIDPYRRFGS